MRTFILGTVAAIGLALGTPANAQDAKQDFRLINRTGYELKEVYVSPAKADNWQEDVMGQDVLEDGKSVNIHFSPKVKTCKWDLKVVYTDDNSSAVWSDIDLCSVDKITIHYDRKNDVTRASFD
ncbi:MAG: argininosuccinate lyase [Alphaproteobacteria bacterium]|nr:argininosuccinate lyase [Alphaproteobacteria bacterium]